MGAAALARERIEGSLLRRLSIGDRKRHGSSFQDLLDVAPEIGEQLPGILEAIFVLLCAHVAMTSEGSALENRSCLASSPPGR